MPETRPSTGDIISNFDGRNIHGFMEHHPQEDYYEKVNIPRTRVEIDKKSIPIYSNQTNVDIDPHVDQPKPNNYGSSRKTTDGPHWTVEALPISTGKRDPNVNINVRVDGAPSGHRITIPEDEKKVVKVDDGLVRIDTRGKGKARPTISTESRIIHN